MRWLARASRFPSRLEGRFTVLVKSQQILLSAGEVGENPALTRNRDRIFESRNACRYRK